MSGLPFKGSGVPIGSTSQGEYDKEL